MSTTEQTPVEFEKLLEYLRLNRSLDLTGYKRTTLTRRMQKRMQAAGVERYNDYVDYLEVHPDEFEHLLDTILINVTSFFRDSTTWEHISRIVLPRILASKRPEDPIRVWSAGCASGEETYTIAMLLAEQVGEQRFKEQVKIYATDLDEGALAKARMAAYTESEMENIPPELVQKYFERSGNRHVFLRDLRRAVIFGKHDLTRDAPISRIDLIVCRNVLMYFNTEAQAQILSRLNYALNERGYLFLGKAEMLLTHIKFFTPVDLKNHVFMKTPTGVSGLMNILNSRIEEGNGDGHNPQRGLHEAGFDAAPLAQVVIDSRGIVSLINERARSLFHLSPQDLGRPFRDLELSYRPVELRSAIEQVTTRGGTLLLHEVEFTVGISESHYLDIQIVPLNSVEFGMVGVSLTFIDITDHKRLQRQLEHANQELETAMEELQSTNEELETTNEELQSTVEELETTNEELQSTNEELETMNEELQSTNEELETMNDEMTQRSTDLNQLNFYFESILTSLNSGVIVANPDLTVQVWNHKSEDLWGLRWEEARGRVLFTLDIGLPLAQLKEPINAMLTGEMETFSIQLSATNRRGRAIVCNVTCTPLFDARKEVKGVVIVIDQKEHVEG